MYLNQDLCVTQTQSLVLRSLIILWSKIIIFQNKMVRFTLISSSAPALSVQGCQVPTLTRSFTEQVESLALKNYIWPESLKHSSLLP